MKWRLTTHILKYSWPGMESLALSRTYNLKVYITYTKNHFSLIFQPGPSLWLQIFVEMVSSYERTEMSSKSEHTGNPWYSGSEAIALINSWLNK